jgi:hypothetical protein
MPKGFKDFSDDKLISKKQLNQSAHPVVKVERRGENKTTTWFTKDLASAQEAQIECMTGEIYRYLLGPDQPKIRVKSSTYVASESVNFVSFRDIMEKQDLRPSFNNFKKAFCDHIEGFMMVAFSSIFFEENDLSDNNYGLVVTGAHGAIKDFGGFVKIDHGQSFNSLRIGENWFLRFAEIKFFKPIKPVPQTDWRKLTDRKKIKNPLKSGTRKYHLSHEFFDRIVMDFVDAGVTEAYICNLTYQPSTSPFYDPRLLPIIAGLGEERYEKMEIAKYWALAKLAYTSEAAYLHIAKNATDTDQIQPIWQKVQNKIRENRNELLVEVAKDPDFLRFCRVYDYYIKERINDAWNMMIHKRGGTGALSERYGATAMGINPVDDVALADAAQKGGEYQRRDVIPRSRNLIEGFLDFVGSQKWSVGLMGGTTVTLRGKQVKVPAHIAQLVNQLDLYAKSGHRVMRAVRDMVSVIHDAHHSTSTSRKASTTQAYFALYTQVQQYAQEIHRLGVSAEAARRIHPMLVVA